MQRIAYTLARNDWKVRMIGTLNKNSSEYIPEGYLIRRIPVRPGKGILFYLMMNMIFFYYALTAKESYIYSVDLDTLPAARLATWLNRKKIIWDSHEIFTAMPELYERPIVRSIWKALESIFAPGIIHVLTVTPGVASFLSETYHLKPFIVYNYPDIYPDHTDARKKFDSRIVFFQGALNQGRGLHTLLETMKTLDDTYILQIAGVGPEESALKSWTIVNSLGHRVHFLGRLSPADLKEKTQGVFVGISLLDDRHQNSMVSLANKNLDYIMGGVPAITMDFPEYKKINDRWEVAILLKESTPSALQSAVYKLGGDFSMYQKMHEQCRLARQELNWENESTRLIEYFKTI
jgi:glycosyltransferase involved in cell wall biosynthesis